MFRLPWCPTCFTSSRALVPTYLCDFASYVSSFFTCLTCLMCLLFLCALRVLLFYLPNVSSCFTWITWHTCFPFSRALRSFLRALGAYMYVHLTCLYFLCALRVLIFLRACEISNNWPKDFFGTNVYETVESCW